MPSELDYFAALSKIPRIGPGKIRSLFEIFGSASAIWNATDKELAAIDGIGAVSAAAFTQARSLAKVKEITVPEGMKVITLSDTNYPKNLFNIYDPPPYIFYKGDIIGDDDLAVSVVGTRSSSVYGEQVTRNIVSGLVEAGVTIVSGLAIGIDTAAHIAALNCGGRTIAVLGSGLNTIYPRMNRRLSEQIAASGALMSEFMPDDGIEIWNFPRRNRIISGLSLGTLVVEGECDSGSLISARFALEQDREVFAIPGPVDRKNSRGPNSLIKQGAKLVETVNDILEELNIKSENAAKVKFQERYPGVLTPEELAVYECLTAGEKNLDQVSFETGRTVQDLSSVMIPLLIKGAVKELPGKTFCAVI